MDSLAQSRCRLMAEDRGSGGSRTASGACGVEQVSSLSGWCFATLTCGICKPWLLRLHTDNWPQTKGVINSMGYRSQWYQGDKTVGTLAADDGGATAPSMTS